MAERALAAVLACLFSAVALAANVERVYAAGPPASVLVFAIAPEKLVGWTRAMRPSEAQFFDERYAKLPELGRLTGRGDTANVEVVLRSKADLIVDVGSTAPSLQALARSVEERTGIRYALLDGRIESTPATLRTLGRRSLPAPSAARRSRRQGRSSTMAAARPGCRLAGEARSMSRCWSSWEHATPPPRRARGS